MLLSSFQILALKPRGKPDFNCESLAVEGRAVAQSQARGAPTYKHDRITRAPKASARDPNAWLLTKPHHAGAITCARAKDTRRVIRARKTFLETTTSAMNRSYCCPRTT